MRRLHWGCGGNPSPGWINSDIKRGRGIDVTADVRAGLPLATGSVDYIVSVHALQEVPYREVVDVLAELRRPLKPDGVLRLCLPDLDRGIEAYQRGDREYFLVPDDAAESLGGKLVVQMLWYGYSTLMFTADFIDELLRKAGFGRVDHCSYRETRSPYPDIVILDNRPAESLFVEASG